MVSVSNEQPVAYAVQKHPQRAGWAIVTLRDTATQQENGTWCCDEYTRDVPYSPDLLKQISENSQIWLYNLRATDPGYQTRTETASQIADLTDQACNLAEQVIDLRLTLADMGVTI